MIQDSGYRTKFESGAVRDIPDGKGRCDLMPLDVISTYLGGDEVVEQINYFLTKDDASGLYVALDVARRKMFDDEYTMILEVSIHFEEGAKKYGTDNWKKGIPISSYINSALRHYFKWCRGDIDEHHDRAFCWNLMCAIWTINHENAEAEVKMV